ncbi:MAG: response regulator [Planctomycetes bacterium]|nr:response regulator [Planctomycetota bacterium]
MPSDTKRVQDFLDPISQCSERDTLTTVWGELNAGRPVALFWEGRWRLVTPDDSLRYPETRRVIDLPLVDVPQLDARLPVEEAIDLLGLRHAQYALVMEGGSPLGFLSMATLLRRVADTSRESAREERLLARVHEVLATRRPGEALQACLACVAEEIPIDAGSFLVHRPECRGFQAYLQWVRPEHDGLMDRFLNELFGPGKIPVFPLGVNSYPDEVLRTRQALYVPDTSRGQFWGDEVRARAGFKTNWVIPLVLREDLSAMLILGSWKVDAFPERQRRSLLRLAPAFAAALEAWHYEEGLRADARRRVETVLECLPLGVILLDLQRRPVLVNPLGRRYLSDLAGMSEGGCLERLGPSPITDFFEPHPEGTAHEVAVQGIPRRTFEVLVRPAAYDRGQVGRLLLLRDVTAERDMQQKMEAQDRLVAIGQLAAGIAHDFNNFLTSIIGFTELLQKSEAIPEKLRQQLALVSGQGWRAAELVRRMLDFSRRSVAERGPMTLGPFLKEMVGILSHTIPEKVQISLDLTDCENAGISGNPTQIQQILTNLALNARDAMPSGGHFRIQVSSCEIGLGDAPSLPGLPPGRWLLLAVSDTGAGIPPEHLPRLFEPFFTTKEPGRGTGLGLAQVYGLVKMHNGYIDVASEVGQGTTFRIYLPLCACGCQTPELEPAAVEVKPDAPGGTVLLVEDEPVVLQVVSSMLEKLGYRVLSASNGREALDRFDRDRRHIDLMITDMVMPEVSGVQLVTALRRTAPDLRIVVLSGYPLEEETAASELVALPHIYWLQKPVKLAELKASLLEALSRA